MHATDQELLWSHCRLGYESRPTTTLHHASWSTFFTSLEDSTAHLLAMIVSDALDAALPQHPGGPQYVALPQHPGGPQCVALPQQSGHPKDAYSQEITY